MHRFNFQSFQFAKHNPVSHRVSQRGYGYGGLNRRNILKSTKLFSKGNAVGADKMPLGIKLKYYHFPKETNRQIN